MAHAVQHHLGHGRLAAGGLAPGFIIDGLGQAFELARALQGVAQLERAGAAAVDALAEPGLLSLSVRVRLRRADLHVGVQLAPEHRVAAVDGAGHARQVAGDVARRYVANAARSRAIWVARSSRSSLTRGSAPPAKTTASWFFASP